MKKKRMKNWEKYFIIGSCIFILCCCGFYSYRLSIYYKEEHKESFLTVKKFYDILTNKNNIIYSGEGLVKEGDNTYIFKGEKVNNYVKYSGMTWRVVSVDDNGVKLILQDNLVSLHFDGSYNESNVVSYLNQFASSLKDSETYLTNGKYNIDSFELESLKDENIIESKVGLLSVSEYMKAGAAKSYLNNNTYFYLSNSNLDAKQYYVYSEGGVEAIDNDNSFYSVRPVISLSKEVVLASGNGEKDNPYVLESSASDILALKGIGNYVNVSNNTYRVIEVNDSYIKLIMSNYLMEEDKEVKLNYKDAVKYLEKLEKNIDKNVFVKCDFANGEYTKDTNYLTSLSTKKSYVSLPSVIDMFSNEINNIYLVNDTGISGSKYLIDENKYLYLEDESEEHKIILTMCISKDSAISSGEGTKESPFELGGQQ